MAKRNFLFFDRHWILNHCDERKAVGDFSFRLCPPAKPKMPFMVADKPWESMALGWCTMLFDGGRYRLWYEAYDKNYTSDSNARLCYAESGDGERWVKPLLRLCEYDGGKENNIVFDGTQTQGLGLHGTNVFIDPTSPPEARYRMIYMGMPGGSKVSVMGFAYSPDGLDWRFGIPEKYAWCRRPVAGFGSDTQSVVYWDPDIRSYVGYFRNWAGNYGRAIDRATTNDFSRWPHPATILTVDEGDPFGVDFYNNAATRYVSEGDVAHFLFISVFHMDTDTLNVQLATSRDGVRYKRLDRRPFVENGKVFDGGSIYLSPGVCRFGGESAMAGLVSNRKHGEATPEKISYDGGYVMLKFPNDRFQGLAADGTFEFSLAAFENAGASFGITVNADTVGGEIRGGLMPRTGPASYLKGFSPEDCIPVKGTGTGLSVAWKGGNRIPRSLGEQIDLRLILKKSILYSVGVDT